jgi:hypothetical protein
MGALAFQEFQHSFARHVRDPQICRAWLARPPAHGGANYNITGFLTPASCAGRAGGGQSQLYRD